MPDSLDDREIAASALLALAEGFTEACIAAAGPEGWAGYAEEHHPYAARALSEAILLAAEADRNRTARTTED